MPKATDKSSALCMYEKCLNHSRFEANSWQVAEQLFAVRHYAGMVEYDLGGFVEKNRDELPKSGLDLLLLSTNDFVRTLAKIIMPSAETSLPSLSLMSSLSKSPRSGAAQWPSVGIQFSIQLNDLRRKIDDTSPNYIQCLKPNTDFTPQRFDESLITSQLRCAGVIKAVQVSRLGYPQRFLHRHFVERYYILGEKANKSNTGKNCV